MTDHIEALRKALAGPVTDGPWRFSPWHIEEGPPAVRKDDYGIVATTASDNVAAFIAAANPATIRTLLDRLDRAEGEAVMLQDILDSRPAINAGLPDTYIRWSQALYSGEAARAALNGDKP